MQPFINSTEFLWLIAYLTFGKVILGLAWTIVMKLPALQQHRVYRVAIPAKQRLRELRNSWHVISDGVIFYLLVSLNAFNFAETSWESTTLTTTLITFIIFYVWVETWYYHTHRLMHKYRWLYKYHKQHHLTLVVTPLSSIAMSSVEKWIFYSCGWLGFMCLISWYAPVNVYGIILYFTYHFFISLHGHSNTEASSANSLFAKLGMGSATSHAIHHTRFRKNYGFSNMFWDKVCGTYAEDTLALQERAINKNGVTSIKTKLSQ